MSYEELINRYYLHEQSRKIKVRFLTPTSFKQNGEYVLFPSIRLIFQSLMMKFDVSNDVMETYSEEVLGHYEEHAKIFEYRLRSTLFSLEKIRIPAFQGEVSIFIKGPQQMVNLAHMLLHFGEYSGVGIKTGMGMGGIKILG